MNDQDRPNLPNPPPDLDWRSCLLWGSGIAVLAAGVVWFIGWYVSRGY